MIVRQRLDWFAAPARAAAASAAGAIAPAFTAPLVINSGTLSLAIGSTLSNAGGTLNVNSGVFTSPTLLATPTTGQVVINASGGTILPGAATGAILNVIGHAGTNAAVVVDGFGATPQLIARRADGTPASPTALQLNDNMSNLAVYGYGATGYSTAPRAGWTAVAEENWSDTAQGTHFQWQTTAKTTTTTVEKMRLTGSGALLVGITAQAGGELLNINGGAVVGTLTVGSIGAFGTLGSHLNVNSGTIDVAPVTLLRTLSFNLTGKPANGQKFGAIATQAGTLLANGGSVQAYIPTAPAATQTLEIGTIHSGTVTNQGTLSISTGGTVTWPTFSAVAIAAGDVVEIVNQATADTTFADAIIGLQFQLT